MNRTRLMTTLGAAALAGGITLAFAQTAASSAMSSQPSSMNATTGSDGSSNTPSTSPTPTLSSSSANTPAATEPAPKTDRG